MDAGRGPGWARAGTGAPLLLGTVWALLPCGLLYSALLVAAMSARPLDGAMVMALFAAGTSVSMMAGPWLWLRLRSADSGQWGVRLAGLALASSSAWAVWMGLVPQRRALVRVGLSLTALRRPGTRLAAVRAPCSS